MRPLSLILLPLLLAACERTPVGPDRVVSPQFAATRSEVPGTIDFVDDPADCTTNPTIGEILLFTGRISYVQRTTTTSSGNVNMTLLLTYDPTIHLLGQTSGTVWMIDAARTHPEIHDNIHGVGESYQGETTEYYTNANSVQLRLKGNEHMTVNANGTVVVARPLVWDCIGG
jgi:hypothetical protein